MYNATAHHANLSHATAAGFQASDLSGKRGKKRGKGQHTI